MRRERSALPADARTALSQTIAERLAELPEWRASRVVHLYIGAVEGEVETRGIALDALQSGRRVVCPRVVSSQGAGSSRLEHREIRSLDDLVESPRGLWEPDPARCPETDPAALDLILVPGLAFDREGHRLGFGAGHYDRFLSALHAPKVALAFSLQLLQAVPHSARDVPVDWIVTESETIACRANRETSEPGTAPNRDGE